MDAKISFALAFVGILVGYIFSNGMPQIFGKIANVNKLSELSGVDIFAAVVVVLLYGLYFLSAIVTTPLKINIFNFCIKNNIIHLMNRVYHNEFE